MEGELLVRVRAAGLNTVVRVGRFAEALRPMILGVEGAGEIAAVGEGVSWFGPGDRVAINP